MTEAELQRILELVNQDKDLFTANSKWTESVNMRGIKEAIVVPNSTDAAVSIAKQGVQNADPLADVSVDKYKDSEPTYSKLTGKFIDKTRVADVNGDGVVDDKDLQLEQQQDSADNKQAVASETAQLNYINDIRNSVSYQQIDPHLFSSTSLTPSVEFANRSITQNTDRLVETLSKHKDEEQHKFSKEEIVEVAQATNVALTDSYTKILTTFDRAVEGKNDEDYKEVFRMIDDLDEKVYGLDAAEKEKIKDLWRKATPEERASLLERSLKGDEQLGMKGVDAAEMEIMSNAGDLLEETKKFAKDNGLNTASCFGGNCKLVADFTMRANFVHLAGDELEKKGQGITTTQLETSSIRIFTNNLDVKITNIAVITQAANENLAAVESLSKKELAEIAGNNLEYDKNVHDKETENQPSTQEEHHLRHKTHRGPVPRF